MTKLEKTVNLMKEENTYRRYAEGDHKYSDFSEDIFNEDKFLTLSEDNRSKLLRDNIIKEKMTYFFDLSSLRLNLCGGALILLSAAERPRTIR